VDNNIKSLEGIFRALGNRRRLQIFRYIKNKKRASVGEIAEHIDLSLPATSRHLVIMEKADVLDKKQESTTVYYFLSPYSHKNLSNLI